MSISVLIEPQAKGFRASTKSPLALCAEGPTEAEALSGLRSAFNHYLSTGARIVEMPVTSVDEVLCTAHELGEDPQFEEYLKSMEEVRRVNNAIPE